MTLTDEQLEESLRAWARDERAEAARDLPSYSEAPKPHRRHLWPMIAAAVVVALVAVGAGLFAATRSDAPNQPGGAGCAALGLRFAGLTESNVGPADVSIRLRYDAGAKCAIDYAPPQVDLIGSDGKDYGAVPSKKRVGDALNLLHRGDVVSFEIHRFLSCTSIPRQDYSLAVRFDSARGVVMIPIGERASDRVSCRGPDLGEVSPVTINPPQTANVPTIRGRLMEVGGPAPGKPRPIRGVISANGPVATTVRAGSDGRFVISAQPGRYRLVARSPEFIANGVAIPCAARTVTVRPDRVTEVTLYCAIK